MQSVEYDGLKQLDNDLKEILDSMPEARRELHEKIASVIKQEVDTQVNTSGLNDSRGKIKSWQEPKVGSGGGYAAVRAEDRSTGGNTRAQLQTIWKTGTRSGNHPEVVKNIVHA